MSDDPPDHVAEVLIQPQGIHALAAVTATPVPAVAPLVFRRARSPSKPVLLLNSVSRKRPKLQKQLQRPRTPATHQLQPRVLPPLISPAPNQITPSGRAALLPHLNQRRDPELLQQASLSPPLTGHPRGPRRPAGTEMQRVRTTLHIGTRRKYQHLHRQKTRNAPLVRSSLLCRRCHYHKQFLSTWTKEKT